MEQAIATTGQSRSVILRAFESMEQKGLAELQLAGYRLRFERLQADPDTGALCEEMAARFAEHEAMEIARIHRMLDYAQGQGCLTANLLAYFGETLDACGHCSVCQGEPPEALPERTTPSLNAFNLTGFNALVAAHPAALARPRQQARFLCGLSWPAVSAVRGLRGNPLFGRCAAVPFAEVLASRSA